MFRSFRLVLASSSFIALLAWSSTASAQVFEVIDPVLDGNVSDQDYAFPDRPLTLEQGGIEASAHLAFIRFSSGGFSSTSSAVLLNGSYGVLGDLEVGMATYLGLDPEFEWLESIAPRAIYSFMKGEATGDPLELAFDAQLVLNFADGGDTLPFAVLGAPLRYKLNDQMYILAGQNLITLGLEASVFNVNANATFVYVVQPDITIRADTQIFSAAFRDGNSTIILADTLPLAITGIYNVLPLLDVTVGFTAVDLTEGFDIIFVTGGVLSRF